MRDDVPWLFSLVSRFALRRSHAGLKRTERIVDASNVLLTHCKVIRHDWIDRVSFLQLGTGMVFTLYYLHLFTMYFSIYDSTWFNMIQHDSTWFNRRRQLLGAGPSLRPRPFWLRWSRWGWDEHHSMSSSSSSPLHFSNVSDVSLQAQRELLWKAVAILPGIAIITNH